MRERPRPASPGGGSPGSPGRRARRAAGRGPRVFTTSAERPDRPAPRAAPDRAARGAWSPRPMPAARLATASASSVEPARSTTSAMPTAGGSSCSRTTSDPRRALVGQCTRRAASPGTYGRTARTVSPAPYARGGDGRASSVARWTGAQPGRGGDRPHSADRQRDGKLDANEQPRANEDAERGRRPELDPHRVEHPPPTGHARHDPVGGRGREPPLFRGSSTRSSTREARPCKRTCSSWRSPTVESGGPHTSTDRRASDTIGSTIPNTNRVKAKTPTATTVCSPDAARREHAVCAEREQHDRREREAHPARSHRRASGNRRRPATARRSHQRRATRRARRHLGRA